MEFTKNDLEWARTKLSRIVQPVLAHIMAQDLQRLVNDLEGRLEIERLMKKIGKNPPPNWPKA